MDVTTCALARWFKYMITLIFICMNSYYSWGNGRTSNNNKSGQRITETYQIHLNPTMALSPYTIFFNDIVPYMVIGFGSMCWEIEPSC